MKKGILALFVVGWWACQKAPVQTTRIGELEELIKKGNMKTHVHMRDYQNRANLYAIGSATNLDGFIQVINSKAYNCRVRNDSVMMDSSFTWDATLWLMAEVADWHEIDIPASVTDWNGLQEFIGNELAAQKVNRNAVTPFLLRGTPAEVDWRVVHWDTTDHDITFRKTMESGLKGILRDEPIEVIGFYSKKPYEILAHKSMEIHMHFVTQSRALAGHIDGIKLDGRMKLLLPAQLYVKS
ncbi:MAG: acetolactate decarboxylase [Chitinophagales bacterium]|nr:acetolactate decarboxylase [Chitinophagales bacterium]MDW8393083.1 acetolactate decarboxylase [Chitinophagales bacterium]